MKPGQPSFGNGLGEDVTGRLLAIMAGYPEIRQVILFGSRAKGSYRPGSDIDLCLDAPSLTLPDWPASTLRNPSAPIVRGPPGKLKRRWSAPPFIINLGAIAYPRMESRQFF